MILRRVLLSSVAALTLAVGAVGHHLDGVGLEDAPQAHHHHHLVDEVPAGLPLGSHEVHVDDAAAGVLVVAARPHALDDELDAAVVELDIPWLALGAHAREQGVLALHHPGPHLAILQALGHIGVGDGRVFVDHWLRIAAEGGEEHDGSDGSREAVHPASVARWGHADKWSGLPWDP